MKKLGFFFIATAMLLIGTNSYAEEARSLASVMKDMGKDYKLIALQASDASQNASSAALSDHLAKLIFEAQQYLPPSIAKLPVDQREAALNQYHQTMTQLLSVCMVMEDDFKKGDNAAAQAALGQMSDLKSQGHDKFKQ